MTAQAEGQTTTEAMDIELLTALDNRIKALQSRLNRCRKTDNSGNAVLIRIEIARAESERTTIITRANTP